MRILDNLASYMCPHGGQVTVVTTNSRVKADGARYLLRVSDIFTVLGCPLNIWGVPSPCLTVTWTNESKRVKVMGVPVLLETSVGLCLNAAGVPQGPVMVMGPQSRAKAL
jgi:hypothetical protein